MPSRDKTPRWSRPDTYKVTPKKRKIGRPKQFQCGYCGKLAGWYASDGASGGGDGSGHRRGEARRWCAGHHELALKAERADRMSEIENMREKAEAEALREVQEFEEQLAALLDEAAELGLAGDALIAHVYADNMEYRTVAKLVRQAALEGRKEAAAYLHSRKHGTPKATGKRNEGAVKKEAPAFLDALAVRDSPDDYDDD